MPKKVKDEREDFIKHHPRVIAQQIPNSSEAEIALLGGMLMDVPTAVNYMTLLNEDDFYTPAHKNIFIAMRDVFTATKPVDLVTVLNRMNDLGTLDESGGAAYLSGLVSEVPSVANVAYYYEILKKHTRLRAMIRISQEMQDAAFALDPGDEALRRAEAELYNLSENGGNGRRFEPVNIFLQQALDDLRARQLNRNAYRGVPTGFAYLDAMLGGGFQNSDLIILAARPGQGKTSFAMNCAVNAALSRRPDTNKPYSVAVFSLEMSAIQLAKRILCSVGNVDMSQANRAIIDKAGWSKLYAAKERLSENRLFIYESADVTPAEILSKCRALKHSGGLDFVMIDYLQLLKSGKNIDNIVREIAEITRALKIAAKELNVPVLLLSQMSRGIEKRTDPTPQLSDLRDSGAIEQDADIVLFLDRSAKTNDLEDPADVDKTVTGNTVYLNVAKHRNGETGSVRLVWVPSTVTFKCITKNPPGLTEPNKRAGLSDTAFVDSTGAPAPVPPDDYDDDGGSDEDIGL